MKLNKIVSAVLLGAAFTVAQAAGTLGFAVGGETTPVVAGVTDAYQAAVNSSNGLHFGGDWSFALDPGASWHIDGVSLTKFTGSSLLLPTTATAMIDGLYSGTLDVSLPSYVSFNFGVNLGAGPHILTINNVSGGSYGILNMQATAVPEPESYAMMLAGLGALGFMSRRRKTK